MPLVVVLAPEPSLTVAPGIAVPSEALVTVPVTVPVVTDGVRVKLSFCEGVPAATEAVRVCWLKPGLEAVRTWFPGASPARAYAPEESVLALVPPLSLTVAPEMALPFTELVTVPDTEPEAGVKVKLTLVVAPEATETVCVADAKPAAEAVTEWLPGGSPLRL